MLFLNLLVIFMKFTFFTGDSLKANWKPGLTVSLVTMPLSISLAVASGASPITGIITAIWAGLVGALFGGSNYNIIGPTGALSGLIASYALVYGPSNIPALALFTGIFILFAYISRLERYLIFIPSSVIHGFTLGVACIIALNQLNFALGLENIPKHEKFIANVIESFKHAGQASAPACIFFITFFLVLLLLRKVIPSIPGAIMVAPFGIAIGYATTIGLLPFHLETLGNKFGVIRPVLIQIPTFNFSSDLLLPSLVVAFVAIIETMLSAKIADAVTKTRHNSRKEIFGLGLANIVSGLVGGLPATAALARTAFNIKTGATSSLSAFLNSLFTALGALLFLSYFAYLPMAVIAAILLSVVVTMVGREHFERLFHHDKPNFIIAMLVAAITVYEDPIIGILLGAIMALLLLVNKLAHSYYEISVHESAQEEQKHTLDAHKKNILTYTFKGKLVYLNSQAHILRFYQDFAHYKGIILLLHDIYFIDLDGVDALEEIIELSQNRGQKIILVSPSDHVKKMLSSSSKFQELENKGLVFDSLDAALGSL